MYRSSSLPFLYSPKLLLFYSFTLPFCCSSMLLLFYSFGPPKFGWPRLTSADLGWPRLTSADLGWPRLTSADLGWPRLTSADLGWPRLTSADLGWPRLTSTGGNSHTRPPGTMGFPVNFRSKKQKTVFKQHLYQFSFFGSWKSYPTKKYIYIYIICIYSVFWKNTRLYDFRGCSQVFHRPTMKEITQNTSLRWNGRRRSGGFGPGAIQTSQVSKKFGSKVTKSDVSDFRLIMLLVFVVFGCIFIVEIFRSTVASCPLHWNI